MDAPQGRGRRKPESGHDQRRRRSVREAGKTATVSYNLGMTAPAPAPVSSLAAPAPRLAGVQQMLLWAVAVLALTSSALLWQKLAHTQEQLARQSAASGAKADEAQAQARQAQGMAQTAKARLAVAEGSLDELLSWQRQTDELLQTAVRARDDSLVTDLAAMLEAAQIQARLSGDVTPLQTALHLVQERISQAANPRLAAAARAARQDLERAQSADVPDIASLLAQLDALWGQVDAIPAANDAADASDAQEPPPEAAPAPWWQRAWREAWSGAGRLVRVSRIDRPDASMMTPQQVFFVRQHVKLRLQGARLALLAGRRDAAQADLARAEQMLGELFAPQAQATRDALARLRQAQAALQGAPMPSASATLAALADAASASSEAISAANAADADANGSAKANATPDTQGQPHTRPAAHEDARTGEF